MLIIRAKLVSDILTSSPVTGTANYISKAITGHNTRKLLALCCHKSGIPEKRVRSIYKGLKRIYLG